MTKAPSKEKHQPEKAKQEGSDDGVVREATVEVDFYNDDGKKLSKVNHKEFHILVEEEGGNGCESKLKPDEPSPVPHDSKSKVKPHTHKTPDTGKIKKKPSNESAKGGKANKDKKPDDMTNCEIDPKWLETHRFKPIEPPDSEKHRDDKGNGHKKELIRTTPDGAPSWTQHKEKHPSKPIKPFPSEVPNHTKDHQKDKHEHHHHHHSDSQSPNQVIVNIENLNILAETEINEGGGVSTTAGPTRAKSSQHAAGNRKHRSKDSGH